MKQIIVHKATKQFLQLLLFVIFFSACKDDEENYPIEPHIEYVKLRAPGTDTLRLVFSFTDGDADFGLNNEDPAHSSFPYNQLFFFQENNGAVDTLHTTSIASQSGMLYEILDIPNPHQGKLVSPRTRKKAGYEYLPEYNCSHYEYLHSRNLLMEQNDASAIDSLATIIDTLKYGSATYYHILDTLLTAINPAHFNIEVDFLVNGVFGFEEFDWRREFCSQSFDGRVPAGCTGQCRPFEIRMFTKKRGEISYNMTRTGLTRIFFLKKMKLRFRIKDRALHRSNTEETPEFSL